MERPAAPATSGNSLRTMAIYAITVGATALNVAQATDFLARPATVRGYSEILFFGMAFAAVSSAICWHVLGVLPALIRQTVAHRRQRLASAKLKP